MFFGDAEAQEAFETAKSKLNALNHANSALENTLDGRINKMVNLRYRQPVSDTPACQAELNALSHLKRNDDESLSNFIQRTCVWCSRSRGEENENTRTTLEFLCRSSGIFLHALSYTLVDGYWQQIPIPNENSPVGVVNVRKRSMARTGH